MNCRSCPAELSARNKSGYCVPCGNRARYQSPEFRERQREGLRRADMLDPARVDARKRRLTASVTSHEGRAMRADLARVRGLAAIGRRHVDHAARKKAGAHRTLTMLGDIAPRHRDTYRMLTRTKRYSASEARSMIFEMERHEGARS